MQRLILASGSPRRADLMREAGYEFEIIPSPAEELHDESMPLVELCETNAVLKAEAIFLKYPEAVVLGSDTLVYIDETPLGKPKDLDEARQMLRRLSGRAHTVCSGVAIFHLDGREVFHGLAQVYFKELSDEAIEDYLGLVHVLDKAGSYAIQEYGELTVERIEGEFSNVMGLPISLVKDRLADLGITC